MEVVIVHNYFFYINFKFIIMKNIFINTIVLLFFIFALNIQSHGSEKDLLTNNKIGFVESESNYAFYEIENFASASCSATVGTVTVETSVNCFLCTQAAADRKCQRALNVIVSRITINPDCECIN